MNFYDVLAAEKWGGGIPTINFFDLLFAQSMGGGEQWQTYEGTLPATLNANGDDMRQYQIYGATGGVGDVTKNKLDKRLITNNYPGTSIGNVQLSVKPNTPYTLKTNCPRYSSGALIFFDDKTSGSTTSDNGVWDGQARTITSTSGGVLYVRYRGNNSGYDLTSYSYMLTEGTTPPENYVPYGYEVDISTSDGTNVTTTPIYIGNEPLWAVGNYVDYTDYQNQKVVRAIKKYVLTGNENWEEITGTYASRTYFRYIFAPINYCVRHVCTSSHFTQTSITTATTTVGFDAFDSSSVNGEVLAIRPSNVRTTTLADFKAWLAAQYSAGTPVTIWCALTTAEEEDPPVSLPALPTVEGETIIDYAGESVAPEKVYFEYAKGGN